MATQHSVTIIMPQFLRQLPRTAVIQTIKIMAETENCIEVSFLQN